MSERWDANGQKSLMTPLDALLQENLKQTTEEEVESISVELERKRWGEEAQMERQPESMDMSDVEWETGTQRGAFITQRQGFSQKTKLKHAQSGDSILILNISAFN